MSHTLCFPADTETDGSLVSPRTAVVAHPYKSLTSTLTSSPIPRANTGTREQRVVIQRESTLTERVGAYPSHELAKQTLTVLLQAVLYPVYQCSKGRSATDTPQTRRGDPWPSSCPERKGVSNPRHLAAASTEWDKVECSIAEVILQLEQLSLSIAQTCITLIRSRVWTRDTGRSIGARDLKLP